MHPMSPVASTTHLTVRMPEKAWEATEDMRPKASELLRSTAFVCCLYSDAVKAVATTTPVWIGASVSKSCDAEQSPSEPGAGLSAAS